MTVYVTADELLDLEHARLSLRRHQGLAVDRGRLVREAIAIALADLEANGDDSVLVQRLTGDDRTVTSRHGRPRRSSARGGREPAFAVRLDNFEGPFDLLLSLIASTSSTSPRWRCRRSPTSSSRTSRPAATAWDLEQTTSFLLVASTLLDLKAARLLPQGDVEDEEDLALLEARDLLFARLLQYRAFKQVAGVLEQRMAEEARRHPRVGRARGAVRDAAARGADRPRAGGVRRRSRRGRWSPSRSRRCRPRRTSTPPTVSVREQATLVVDRLRRQRHDDLPGAGRRRARTR